MTFKLEFERDQSILVSNLVASAVLPLHHHMSPADEEQSDEGEDEVVDE